jgi:hypothetical protein
VSTRFPLHKLIGTLGESCWILWRLKGRRWLGQLVRFGNSDQLDGSAAGSLDRAVSAYPVDSAIRQGQLGDPRVMAAIEGRQPFAVLHSRSAN